MSAQHNHNPQQLDRSLAGTMAYYLLDGVDFSLPGNGGPECEAFISGSRRAVEDVLGLAVSMASLAIGLRWHSRPPSAKTLRLSRARMDGYTPARLALLFLVLTSWVLEAGYKLVTRQMIFLNQPCHVMCLVQVVLLATPHRSSWLTYLYRVHVYFLQGVVMAVIFPVTNTLFLPGEVFTYWLEHAALLGTALYLLRQGGLYTVEPFRDLSWAFLSYGVWGVFHWGYLEAVSLVSHGNMNSMLCPAISDPFYGPDWRMWALGHQFILNLAAGKIFGGIFGIREEKGKGEAARMNGGGAAVKDKPS